MPDDIIFTLGNRCPRAKKNMNDCLDAKSTANPCSEACANIIRESDRRRCRDYCAPSFTQRYKRNVGIDTNDDDDANDMFCNFHTKQFIKIATILEYGPPLVELNNQLHFYVGDSPQDNVYVTIYLLNRKAFHNTSGQCKAFFVDCFELCHVFKEPWPGRFSCEVNLTKAVNDKLVKEGYHTEIGGISFVTVRW
jgi:hypothetical protein